MATWSGLFDGTTDVDGSGPPYAQVSGKPRGEYLRCLMQKRGLYGYAKEMGSDVPANRKVGDYAYIVATKNFLAVPGSATDGRSAPNRDIELSNVHGDARPLEDKATPAAVGAAELSSATDTRRNFEYVVDSSGNGGVALTPGNPSAHP